MELCDPLGEIVYKGYLCKLKATVFGKNQDRYFVLTSRGELKYFEDNQNYKPVGKIQLKKATKVSYKNKTITIDKCITDKNNQTKYSLVYSEKYEKVDKT